MFFSLCVTDLRTMEPSPFDPKRWLYEFNGPGLRYEVVICIRTGILFRILEDYHLGHGQILDWRGVLL